MRRVAARAGVVEVGQQDMEPWGAQHEVPGDRRARAVLPLVAVGPQPSELHGRLGQVLPESERQYGLVDQAQIEPGIAGKRIGLSLTMKGVITDHLGHAFAKLGWQLVERNHLGRIDSPGQSGP